MISQIAEALLKENGIQSPPVPVQKIAEMAKLQIQKQEVDGSDISGFIFRQGEKAIIGVNSANAPVRQRFTIAHELGHYLIHTQGADKVHVDRLFDIKFRDDLSSQGTDSDEREANFFAAELLMPRKFIKADLEKINQVDLEDGQILVDLANRYEVSTQALLFRLAYLGYVEL
jgi:Zn-dependent peptidase ImmA (M78 family)